MQTQAAITGADLIALGFQPGPSFGPMIKGAGRMRARGLPRAAITDRLLQIDAMHEVYAEIAEEERLARQIDLREVSLPFTAHLERGPSEEEIANYDEVVRRMEIIGRTPVVQGMTLMPDACPVGGDGDIPVGGAVVSTEIHPGFHSADVCCSVALTVFHQKVTPQSVLELVHEKTHFGRGGRTRDPIGMSRMLLEQVRNNRFLAPLEEIGHTHMGTQGDGNHFAFVGVSKTTGRTCLVTHHGSRGFGAGLYKRGMEIAERTRRELCPDLPKACAWIPADSEDGRDYWAALQIVREWTLENHLAIHTRIPYAMTDFLWNEHNFVFKREDGLFYHGKGATPATPDYPLTLVPLNMAQPVLVTRGLNKPEALGFAPHGAGRLVSRTDHLLRNGFTKDGAHREGRTFEDMVRAETQGLDVRFYCGAPDISELPSAYKDAPTVRRQMEGFGLAEVLDEITPYGCIMAGDVEANAPWRKNKERADVRR